MPATYTHHMLAKDIYNNMNENLKSKVDENLFYLFAKSFDALFFYKNKVGKMAHKNYVNDYFKNMIEYLENNNLTSNKECLAYLYGSICHYVADSIIHPFVFYYSGVYNKNNKKTYKYKGMHAYMEIILDHYLCLNKNNMPIYKINLKRQIFKKVVFANDLKKMLDATYLKTFNIKKGSKLYIRSYKNYRFVFNHIMVSRLGIKKFLYKVIDKFNILKNLKLEYHCYHFKNLDSKYLNLNHKKWYYPINKNIAFHYSFFDLYDLVIVETNKLINLLNDYFNGQQELKKVLKAIGNNSYITGVNWQRKGKMKYFKDSM